MIKNGLALLVLSVCATCFLCVVWSPEAIAAPEDDEFVIDALVYNRLYLALDRVNRIYGLYELQALPIPKLSEMITLDDYRPIKNTHVDKALFEEAYFAVAKIALTYNVGPSMAVANIFSEIPRVYRTELAAKSAVLMGEGSRKSLLLWACVLLVAVVAIAAMVARGPNADGISPEFAGGGALGSEQASHLDQASSTAVQDEETIARTSTVETDVGAPSMTSAAPEITLMSRRLRTVAIFGLGVIVTMASVGVWARFYSGQKAAETIRIGPPRIVSTEFAEGEEPNVIIILADDLGYSDLSCYGAKGISTPNCDRLAAAGRKFLNAHSPAALCSPTRYGLLTGQYAWRAGLPRGVLGPLSPLLIDPERYTLADLFKEHGYATGCVGKWHLGFGDTRYTNWNKPLRPGPLEVGFDSYFGVPVSPNMLPRVYVEDDHVVGRKEGEEIILVRDWGGYVQKKKTSGERVQERIGLRHTEKAVQFIEENADHRFFLYFPTAAIHSPLVPAPAFKGSSKIGAYGDYVQQFDWTVGRILETLDKHGLSDNTLVIVTSDNGGSRLLSPRSHDPNASLRGGKGEVYEGGHRVPFIARWPGHILAGSTSDALISLADFLATFAALFGKSLPENAGEDSIDVLLELLGRPHTEPLRSTAIYQASAGTLAIQAGPWKLIPARHGGGIGIMLSEPDESDPVYASLPEGQLYNLRKDLGETENLYDLRPKVAVRLTALLERYREQGHSRPQPRKENISLRSTQK